jgi:hypothetical protein
MNNSIKQQPSNCLDTSFNDSLDRFNFDVWASAVRRQMVASLQKRGSERESRVNRKN